MMTFSERYLRPTVMQDDSPRMRVQLLALFDQKLGSHDQWKTWEQLRLRVGVEVPVNSAGVIWAEFFKQGDLRDVLDCLTIAAGILRVRVLPSTLTSPEWRDHVQAIFDAQRVNYLISDDNSILLRVDEAFENDKVSALALLDAQRYRSVRSEFTEAYKALSSRQADGKRSIRGMFEACEVVFKLMFPTAQRLAAPQLGQHLTPFITAHYVADRPAQQAADKLPQSFTDWVAAAQFYRHGQGQEEPNQPPLEIAVLILSAGAAHLRWLIHLDQAKLAAQA